MPEPASSRLGLIAPSDGDQIEDYPAVAQAMVARHEAVSMIFGAGARGSRPVSTPGTPGKVGREYLSTGDGGIDRDTGTAWVTVKDGLFAVLPTASGTGAGLDAGMEILFQTAAMVTAGVPPYLLRYDSSLSGSSKWAVISAAPLIGRAVLQESTGGSTTNYSNLATILSVTCPVTGVWLVAHEAFMSGTGTDQSFSVGATAADIGDHIAGTGSLARSGILKTITGGAVVTAKVRSVGGSGTFDGRLLSLTPVRLG